MSKELLTLALEAVEIGFKAEAYMTDADYALQDKAAAALRQALNAPLAEQPAPATELREQEPVGWVDDGGTVFWKDKPPADGADLYTSPPTLSLAQRKPLTDEQIHQCFLASEQGQDGTEFRKAFARAIEAAHGIKENT